MTIRSGIMLCAVITGLCGLTLCQPPRPRIMRVDMPSSQIVNSAEMKVVLTASHQAKRVIQAHPGGEVLCLRLCIQPCRSGGSTVVGEPLMNHAG